jgi:hypothetical protein
MSMIYRAVLLVLLLTVPFQAALGATGLVCATGTHHSQDAQSPSPGHGTATDSQHHHETTASGTHHDVASDPGSHGSHGASDKCKTCSECCFSAAVVPASQPTVFAPDTPLRVSSIVEPDIVSRAGDGLFRPPRTTAV